MIKPKFTRHYASGTKEIVDLLEYNNKFWQLGRANSDSRELEAVNYYNPQEKITLKEIWEGVGQPDEDGEFEQYDILGYELI